MQARRFLLPLLALALLGGCGGGGSDDELRPSLYEGNWSGTWTSATAGDGGSISMVISPDGSLVGSMGRSTGATGTLVGTVSRAGEWTATAGFGASGNFRISGQLLRADDQLLSNYTYIWLGTTYGGSLTMTGGGTGS